MFMKLQNIMSYFALLDAFSQNLSPDADTNTINHNYNPGSYADPDTLSNYSCNSFPNQINHNYNSYAVVNDIFPDVAPTYFTLLHHHGTGQDEHNSPEVTGFGDPGSK